MTELTQNFIFEFLMVTRILDMHEFEFEFKFKFNVSMSYSYTYSYTIPYTVPYTILHEDGINRIQRTTYRMCLLTQALTLYTSLA